MPSQPLDLVASFVISAIGPVVLISGVGLLMLSATNRLSHLIDRIRHLTDEISAADNRLPYLERQVMVLLPRTHLLRKCLLMFTGSILFDAATVIMLFILQLLHIDFGLLIAVLFSISLLMLIGGLIYLMRDVKHNLDALEIEARCSQPKISSSNHNSV